MLFNFKNFLKFSLWANKWLIFLNVPQEFGKKICLFVRLFVLVGFKIHLHIFKLINRHIQIFQMLFLCCFVLLALQVPEKDVMKLLIVVVDLSISCCWFSSRTKQ